MASAQGISPVDEGFRAAVRRLAAGCGSGQNLQICLLSGGANNQVYRIQLDGRDLVAKLYFRHPDDWRNRLEAEFSFASFAWSRGVHAVARPLAKSSADNLAIYEFIPGHQIEPDEVDGGTVEEALEFYLAVNRYKDSEQAMALPLASEPGFSLCEHLDRVAHRIERLSLINGGDEIDREARKFVRDDLKPAWERLAERVLIGAHRYGIDPRRELDMVERCLSPSDFGFHNAIRADGGHLRFIDFEYAGWDDPARMICDFFCQCKVPVPIGFLERFIQAVSAELPRPDACAARVSLLLPVFRLKWCCIVLNEFLAVGAERRRFAAALPSVSTKAGQLNKARQMMEVFRVQQTAPGRTL